MLALALGLDAVVGSASAGRWNGSFAWRDRCGGKSPGFARGSRAFALIVLVWISPFTRKVPYVRQVFPVSTGDAHGSDIKTSRLDHPFHLKIMVGAFLRVAAALRAYWQFDFESGNTCSINIRLNFVGSSKGGLCADCSNHTSRFKGASIFSKYCAAKTAGT
jgi:hypothetical protein